MYVWCMCRAHRVVCANICGTKTDSCISGGGISVALESRFPKIQDWNVSPAAATTAAHRAPPHLSHFKYVHCDCSLQKCLTLLHTSGVRLPGCRTFPVPATRQKTQKSRLTGQDFLWLYTRWAVSSLHSCTIQHLGQEPVSVHRPPHMQIVMNHSFLYQVSLTAATHHHQNPFLTILSASQELAKLLSVLHIMGSSNTSSPAPFIQLVQALHQLVSGVCTPEQLQPLADCWLAMLMAKVLCSATASTSSATAGSALAMPMRSGSGSALAVADDPGSTYAAVMDPGSAQGQRVHVEALLGCATQVRSHACT